MILELASDARSGVAEARAHFGATMAKSDALDDANVSKEARMVKDKAKGKKARLNGARARLAHVFADLSLISVTRFGAARQTGSRSISKPRLDAGKSMIQAIEEGDACVQE